MLESDDRRKDKAVTTIARWWRAKRCSGKAIYFNPNFNPVSRQHSEAFLLFLNNFSKIPKYLTYFQDQALLADLEQGNWGSERLKHPHVHFSAMNLFAAGKISWEQKATISDIVGTTQSFGRFIPFPILTPHGEFTLEAMKHLLPFLHKALRQDAQKKFSKAALNLFKHQVQQLPLSERYFFLFPQQRLVEEESSPSPHAPIRDDLMSFMETIPVIKAKFLKKIDDTILSYKGIVRLSFGAENILGRIEFGERNWWHVFPRLGQQSIDDIDSLSQRRIRPTSTPEAYALGLSERLENVHGVPHEYPDVVIHDEYHRKVLSILGEDVYCGIERIIKLTRETFGFKWSKDIWTLRDADLLNARMQLHTGKESTTWLFFQVLSATYTLNKLNQCDEETKEALEGKPILRDEKGLPRQIALVFVIDFVKNPQAWRQINIFREFISDDYYDNLIEYAQLLNNHGLFSPNMKSNVVKLMHFIENYQIDTLSQAMKRLQIFDKKPQVLEAYQAQRNNKQVFLGFVNKQPLVAQKSKTRWWDCLGKCCVSPVEEDSAPLAHTRRRGI